MTAFIPSVTILILNWNGVGVLPRCLKALLALDYTDYQVVVADNGSQDDSVALVRSDFPDVSLIDLGHNLGFARGYNAAFSRLTNRSDILILLNNDVYVQSRWLAELVKPFADPKVGITGAKLLFLDGIHIQHAGAELKYPLAISRHYAYREVDEGQMDEERDVPYVTGASMAMRWLLAEELGPFDERFSPYYFEEVDVCFRARNAGYRIVYVPDAVAIHHETYSTKKHSAQTTYAFHRNRLRLVLKHYTDDQLLNDFIPAELARLQTTPTSTEGLEAIRRVYLETMLELSSTDDGSERNRAFLTALGQWWEASLRVDPERVPGLVFGKPILDPLFRRLQAGWETLAAMVLFWPIVKRQRATNALLWRIAVELGKSSLGPDDIDRLSNQLTELREELRRIGS